MKYCSLVIRDISILPSFTTEGIPSTAMFLNMCLHQTCKENFSFHYFLRLDRHLISKQTCCLTCFQLITVNNINLQLFSSDFLAHYLCSVLSKVCSIDSWYVKCWNDEWFPEKEFLVSSCAEDTEFQLVDVSAQNQLPLCLHFQASIYCNIYDPIHYIEQSPLPKNVVPQIPPLLSF